MTTEATCPDPDLLRRLLLGELPEVQAQPLEDHLSACALCGTRVESLTVADDLIVAMRRPSPILEQASGLLVEGLIERGRQAWWDDPPTGEAPAARGPDLLGFFGPYRLVSVLGAGGMGVVYLAEQTRPRRRVALKLMKAGAVAGLVRRDRFQAESDVIARLQHPHIIAVHEVGEIEGQPYFTMEFVDGGNLAKRLAAAPLSARAAAELVETLARTVHFAHEHGVVHRDLKPANILMSSELGVLSSELREGLASLDNSKLKTQNSKLVPKIADFGLAKLTGFDSSLTETGDVVGTPTYMAPEQATGRGGDVGPPVDVYALGAILYETLTGRPPFRAATVMETLDQVRGLEPVLPARLQPGLPRDLQTICLKCLEKEPARRYANAQALADDLRRFLVGEPIRARPVSAAVRVAKWARRKPALASMLAVSASLLVALVVGTVAYQGWLRDAVTRAETKEEEARRQKEMTASNYRSARDTLNKILGRLEDRRWARVPQMKELRQEMIEDSLAFFQKVMDQADDADPAVRLDTAVVCRRMADVQLILGRRREAEDNYLRTIQLLEGQPPETRDAPNQQENLAGCYTSLGHLAGDTGRIEECERHHRAALAIHEHQARARPDDSGPRQGIAQCEHNLGSLRKGKRPEEIEAHYQRAIDLRDEMLRARPDDEPTQAALAQSLINLALFYQGTNRPAQATAAYVRADALLRPLVARHPEEEDYPLSLSALDHNWAYLLQDTGQVPSAFARVSEAILLSEEVLRREPLHVVARHRAINSHGVRVHLYERRDRWADAVGDWDRIVELGEGKDWLNRALRVVALGRAGERVRAVKEARALENHPEVSDEGLWTLAGVCARAAAEWREDQQTPSAERDRHFEDSATAAVAYLRKLHDKGYFKGFVNAMSLRTDADLRILRDRPDFQRLLSPGGGAKE